MESVTATYDVGYRLDQDTNVFKEAHEAFEFEYAFVNGNKENKITKDQVKASGLTVTSDMTSLTLVYKNTATQNESKDKKVETANLSGEKDDDSDSEDEVAIASERKTTTYNLYHYALIPGKAMDSSESADNTWFGIGVTSISGVGDPSSLECGIQSNFTYKQEGVVKTLFPNITYKGKIYEYAATGSENADKEGYYTLIPARVNIADGANAGNNRYNPTASGKTYHQDYTMVMNEKNIYTVTYNVMDPGETTYGVLNDYSQRVDAGTSESELKQPTSKDVPSKKTDSAGNKYTFKGWYKNQACTVKADFNGRVNANTNYYGKYVTETYTVKYDSNGGTDVADKTLKYYDTVDISETPIREGYIFDGWYYGSTKVTNQKYATLAKDESTKEITLVAHWKENLKASAEPVVKTYDGNAYGVNVKTNVKDATIRYWNENTGKYDLTESPTKKNVTRDADGNIASLTVKYKVSKEGYDTVTGETTVTINPAAVTVTITGNTKTEKYTGTEKTVTGYTATKSNNLYTDADFGLKADVKAEAKGTNADTYYMGLTKDSFTNKNANFAVTFKVTDGWLKIDKNEAAVTVTIKGKKKTEPYTGTEKTVTGYTTEVTGAEESEVNVALKADAKAEAKGINADTYYMGLTKDSFKVTSNNYKNINVVVEDGSLTINPAAVTVTITGNTKTEKYTGTEKTVTGYTATKSNNLYTDADFGLKADVKAEAKGTNADTYYMGLTKDSFTNKNANFAVTFKVTDGWLKIDKKSIIPDGPNTPEEKKTGIKVTAPKDTTYSGNEQKREPVIEDTKTGKTLDKDDYLLSYSDDVTNAGTVTITVTGEGNYSGEFKVTYKILPRKVTLKSETASKPYDGTALTKPDVTVSDDGFVEGEVSDIKATGLVTTVSEGEVTNTITFTKENNYKAGNYTIDKDEGKLSIRAQSIDPGTDLEKPNPDYTGAKVNSPSDAVYDGNEHKWIPTVTDKADKKLEAGKDYTVEYSTKNFKDVGTIDVTITGKGNYTGTVTRTYKITPKSVTVIAEDKTKVFGEADPKLTAKVAGTLGEDTVKYDVARETGENVGKYTITPSGKAEQGNYSVTYVAGTLTITSQSIDPGTDPEKPNPDYTGAKVNGPSDKVYDGNEHKWSPTVTDKTKTLELGKDYTVEYSTSDFTNVGTIKVTITGIGNYSGTVKRSYKVTPKEYTVTTDSATKTYSGTALTAGGKVEGIVSGETVEFTTTGSQTEVGTSKNTYELVWKSAKATNYTLAKESIGKLTVKAKSIIPDGPDTPDEKKTGITVSEPSDSKYDGKEHKEVLTVTDTKTGKELVAGTDYSVTYSSDLVNAGTVTMKVAGLGNYSGSFTKTYKITKRSVTLTSATVSKVYDGSALTNTSITVSGDGFVEGEGASYEVTGTQTEVGNSANSFEYKLNENTLASNYNITKVVGTLTITAAPAPVTPATPSTPSTPSSTTSTTPRTPSAPQVTTPAETVEKETTPKAEPKKEEKVEEEYTPKASPQYYWALINLICAILTVLFGLLLLISKRHKSEEDDEEDDETKDQTTTNDDEEKEQEKKRGLFTRVLAVLIAIVSVVFFLVTEDLSLPWTWTDQWTIWMVVIGLVQIVVFFVGRKWKNVDDDEDEEEAQQA